MKQENKNPQLKTGEKGLFVLKLIKFMQPGETAYINSNAFHIQQTNYDEYHITLIVTYNCCVSKTEDYYTVALFRNENGDFIIDPKSEHGVGYPVHAEPFQQPKDGPEQEILVLKKMQFRQWDEDAMIANAPVRQLNALLNRMSGDYYARQLSDEEEKYFLKVEKAFDSRIEEFAKQLSDEELENEIEDYEHTIKLIKEDGIETNKRPLEKYNNRLDVLRSTLQTRQQKGIVSDGLNDKQLAAMSLTELDTHLEKAVSAENFELAARIRKAKEGKS